MQLKELLPLFVGDIANNHFGSLDLGLKIIREIHDVTKDYPYKFGLKLQYRHLDTFIHPSFKNKMEYKYVKRFTETKLEDYEMRQLKNEMVKFGFVTVCTPFDEYSVDLLAEHGFDIIKVASCSFTDWPLLEKIVKTDKPIIASTAGVSIQELENVVSFFEHRQKDFALMHCVAEYPTPDNGLELNQIDYLKSHFPDVLIGYSTHENPDNLDAVKIAIAKGASIIERHVGIQSEHKLNDYSSNPQQVKKWLDSATESLKMCGVKDERIIGETKDLFALRRGLFADGQINSGEQVKDVFYAIPTIDGQLTANDFSKYNKLLAKNDIQENQAITLDNVDKYNERSRVYGIAKEVNSLLIKGGIKLPNKVDIEISHHYGLDKFHEYGMAIFTVVNQAYCKKILVLLPNQVHPEQWHMRKTETFNILYGEVWITLNGVKSKFVQGDIIPVNIGVKHCLMSNEGVIIEEISTQHFKDDSFYTDSKINQNKNRKTALTYWIKEA